MSSNIASRPEVARKWDDLDRRTLAFWNNWMKTVWVSHPIPEYPPRTVRFHPFSLTLSPSLHPSFRICLSLRLTFRIRLSFHPKFRFRPSLTREIPLSSPNSSISPLQAQWARIASEVAINYAKNWIDVIIITIYDLWVALFFLFISIQISPPQAIEMYKICSIRCDGHTKRLENIFIHLGNDSDDKNNDNNNNNTSTSSSIWRRCY